LPNIPRDECKCARKLSHKELLLDIRAARVLHFFLIDEYSECARERLRRVRVAPLERLVRGENVEGYSKAGIVGHQHPLPDLKCVLFECFALSEATLMY
jgi:hypothetical protein